MNNICCPFNDKSLGLLSSLTPAPTVRESVMKEFGLSENTDSVLIDELVKIEKNFRRGFITLKECEKCQRQAIVENLETRLEQINELWESQDIEDATSTPEWCEYEKILYKIYDYTHNYSHS